MTTPAERPPDALQQAAEARLGPVDRWQPLSWPAGVARVWGAWAGGRLRAVVKCHGSPRARAQDEAALRRWAPALWPAAPRLLAAVDGARGGLVTSALPGRLALHAALEPVAERRLHRAAGAALARLHALPAPDSDGVSLREAYAARAARWRARAAPHLASERLRAAVRRIDAVLPLLDGVRRRPCHRDYTPRNWVVPPASAAWRVGVLDFEHARPDLPWNDLVRLYAEWWPERDDLRRAFLDGYGALPDAAVAALDGLAALHGLATVAWAEAHRDAAFAAIGRRVLARFAPA